MAKKQLTGPVDADTIVNLAEFFKNLGDSTRLRIIFDLSRCEMSVSDISRSLAMEQSAVSHQLRILKQTRVVRYRKEGQRRLYSLDDDHIVDIIRQGYIHMEE